MPGNRRRRQDAVANRERVLEVASRLLADHPEASMDDVAHAAGVVRRTVYAHFPNRDALIEGLLERASTGIREALAGQDFRGVPAPVAVARFVLTVWQVSDGYRLLLGLARRHLGWHGLLDRLAPFRDLALELLAAGRAEGTFATHLPLPVLSAGLQSMTLALIEAVNDGLWADDGTQAATAILIAAGLSEPAAARAVAAARAS